MRLSYFPQKWKISQIILIAKPGKDETLASLTNLFEKIFLQRLKPILKEKNIFPNHQFGFKEQHSIQMRKNTVQQYFST